MTIFEFGNSEGEAFQYCDSTVDSKTGEPIFEDPKENAGTFYIRSMGDKFDEIQSRRKKKIEHVVNPKTRKMDRIEYFDEFTREQEKANNEELWDYVITGWDDKVLDANGKKIPVTKANKMKLMNIGAFDRFVGRCLRLLSESNVKSEEALEKNLLSGSSGRTTTRTNAKPVE